MMLEPLRVPLGYMLLCLAVAFWDSPIGWVLGIVGLCCTPWRSRENTSPCK